MTEYGWAIKDRDNRILTIHGGEGLTWNSSPEPWEVWWLNGFDSANVNTIRCMGEREVLLNKETLEEYVGE